MKYIIALYCVFTITAAQILPQVYQITDDSFFVQHEPSFIDRTPISPVGDIRAIMGPQGKSICASNDAEALAVIYGAPTTDPNNTMEIHVAYSFDCGATWLLYGPFSPPMRRIYPGVDGTPDFHSMPGRLFFVWQESPDGYASGCIKCMVEENIPSTSSFSSPITLPNSDAIYPWMPSIAVDPDDPAHVIVTAWSYLNDGNLAIYCWHSTDGGYAWSDTMRMVDFVNQDGCSGHIRFGTGGYVLFTYQDARALGAFDVIYPHYVESTDGGYTWCTPTALPDVPLINVENAQFWWHELDCEVIDNELWIVQNDINQVFPDSGGFWLFRGTGTPGNWSWDITDINDYEIDIVIEDWSYYFSPVQYPSVSFDPENGLVVVTFMAHWEIIQLPYDTTCAGWHIGGIYSSDYGCTWTVAAPLSENNAGEIYNWSATEVAHLITDPPSR
jgi:hypothetical protein